MASFLAVFIALIASVFLINHFQTTEQLDQLADLISDNGGKFPAFDDIPRGENKPDRFRPGGLNKESPFTTRYFTVKLDNNGNTIAVDTHSIASVSETEAVDYAKIAVSRGASRGWKGNFRYKLSISDSGAFIVFVSGAELFSSSRMFMLSTLSVFAFGSVIVLLLVILFSKHAVKPAAESFEKQKQFVTDASYELKTLLMLILTNLDIAESELGQNEWLDDIRSESQDMALLVNRLVTLSKMDEEVSTFEIERFNLSETVNETTASFINAAERKGLTLSSNIEPNVFYNGDAGALGQLTSGLLENALKYCDPNGTIQVTLTGGAHPVMTVDNTYAAVGKLELDRLFDRFYRDDKARTAGSGLGLGLSIARAITEKHRGEITALNHGGSAIRFRVRL